MTVAVASTPWARPSSSTESRVTAALDAVGRMPRVIAVASPYTEDGSGGISADGRVAYASVQLADGNAAPSPAQLRTLVQTAQRASTGTLDVEVGGSAVAGTEQSPDTSSETVGVIAAAVVLFAVFGSLFAMALPILTGVAGVGGHEHHGHHDEHAHHEHEHGHDSAQGIEWEDDMVEVNRITTPANTRWKLVDRSTGAENAAIDWRFTVGDRVKIRLVNEMDSDHPMHHPFHVHGAGRFLILSRDGAPEPHLVWKDTVLLRAGATVDILLDVSNPGLWMAHCHIAEHAQSGMMFSFDVARLSI